MSILKKIALATYPEASNFTISISLIMWHMSVANCAVAHLRFSLQCPADAHLPGFERRTTVGRTYKLRVAHRTYGRWLVEYSRHSLAIAAPNQALFASPLRVDSHDSCGVCEARSLVYIEHVYHQQCWAFCE